MLAEVKEFHIELIENFAIVESAELRTARGSEAPSTSIVVRQNCFRCKSELEILRMSRLIFRVFQTEKDISILEQRLMQVILSNTL